MKHDHHEKLDALARELASLGAVGPATGAAAGPIGAHDVMIHVADFGEITDFRSLLKSIAAAGRDVVFGFDLSTEAARTSADDLVAFAETFGFRVLKALRRGQEGSVYLGRLQPHDSAASGSGPQHSPVAAVSAPPRIGRFKVVLAGFFARGNAGDEAILQCLFETISPEFDVIISVDEHGARQGYWDWFPYDRCERMHRMEVARLLDRRVAAFHLGGGGVHPAEAAGQALFARGCSKPVLISGIDGLYPKMAPENLQLVRHFFDAAGFTSLRSQRAFDFWKDAGAAVHLGGDWAWDLEVDASSDIIGNSARAVLVVREVSHETLDASYLKLVRETCRVLKRRGYEIVFVPFAPEDEFILDHMDSAWNSPILRTWWNPRRLKQIIASSGLVVSFGRLHPLVFAASADVPAMLIRPSQTVILEHKHLGKLGLFCEELGIPEIGEAKEVEAHLDKATACAPTYAPGLRERYGARVGDMKTRLMASLRAAPASTR